MDNDKWLYKLLAQKSSYHPISSVGILINLTLNWRSFQQFYAITSFTRGCWYCIYYSCPWLYYFSCRLHHIILSNKTIKCIAIITDTLGKMKVSMNYHTFDNDFTTNMFNLSFDFSKIWPYYYTQIFRIFLNNLEYSKTIGKFY